MAENRSRYAILGALTVAPMSGYDIRQFFALSVGNFWFENYGQIYPMLKALQRNRLIKPLARGPTSRRVAYEITAKGRRVLAAWLAQPAELQPPRNEALLKLFFAREGPPGAAAAILKQCRAHHQQLLMTYAGIAKEIDRHSGNPNVSNWRLTLNYGRHVSEALLQWCDEALKAETQAPDVA